MFKTLWHYIRDECTPRLHDIAFTSEAVVSLLVSVFFAVYGYRLFSQAPKVNDVTTGLIAYAAIVLGFCVSGLTVSLTLPDREFATVLATTTLRSKSSQRNAYSDLLFVFSWTALVHWTAVLFLFVVILLAEGGQSLLPSGSTAARTMIVSVIAGLYSYCFFQFLITLITLSQIGNRYVQHLARSSASGQ